MPVNLKLLYTFITIAICTLTACGGSKNDGTPISLGSSEFQSGVFLPESNFKDRCQTPRTGINPATGKSYPDKSGSTSNENFWLRSWSNRTYLWYNEIVDVDPAMRSTEDYFELLKTPLTTDSGTAKDKYHFTNDTHEYYLSQSGVSVAYGIKWRVISSTVPRKIVIAFTEQNTPATATGVDLKRGMELLEVDTIDVINSNDPAGIATINSGLSPDSEGEEHSFKFRDLNDQIKTVTLQATTITSNPVPITSTISTGTGNVGYLLFNTHNAISEKYLKEAVDQLALSNITDLVLDLRYNGGGYLAIASQLSYMIAGNVKTTGKIFDKTTFNDKHPNTNPITGDSITPHPFHKQTLGISSLPKAQNLATLNLARVFILSTSSTCSASEAIINGLRGLDDVEVILIGSTTCGKPYGFYPTDNCGTTYFSIQLKGENHKGFGDYSDGFSPMNTTGTPGTLVTGCSVADDFTQPLGNQQEGLLQAALNYRQNESCPVPSGKAISKTNFRYSAKTTVNDGLAVRLKEQPFTNQKIMTIPGSQNKGKSQ